MSVNIALATVTDTRTFQTDKSGNILVERVKTKHNLVERKICKDIKKTLKLFLRNGHSKRFRRYNHDRWDGLTGRDITPEALMKLQINIYQDLKYLDILV